MNTSTDSLSEHLAALERLERYRLDSTLKSSDVETTELVFLQREGAGEDGPFVRKTIRREQGFGQAYERIYAQQQAGRSFEHIPIIRECCPRDGELVVVMDYVRGETLQDLIYRQDPSLELVSYVFPSVCDAVGELHTAFDPPLIHRDLKPSNIMISQGKAYIIDFGIARSYNEQAPSDTAQYGTRAYAPPEQFGYGQTTVRSDIYSLGMLLYFCLVERTPDAKLVERGFDDPQIPKSLQAVLANACAFDPKYRYESAKQMKADLEAALFVLRLAHSATFIPRNEEPQDAAAFEPAPVVNPYPAPAVVPMQPSPVPPAPTKKPARKHGPVYNWVVGIFGVILVAASVDCAIDPSRAMADYPRWVSVLEFSAFALAFAATTLQLLDKDRIRRHFPHAFGNLEQRHFRIITGAAWGFFLLCIVVAAIAVS